MSRVLVCVAWPYANGPIHVGHVTGSLLPADIFARYNRMVGNEVIMVSGSDMHGAPITVSADKEKVSPEVVANRYHSINSKAISDLGIAFDLYTSTHTRNHESVTQDMFLRLLEKGHLEKRSTPQFYCSSCARFLPDRYVEGKCPHCGYERARGDQCDSCGKDLNAEQLLEAKCQICGGIPELRDTEHYFLKLSDFAARLVEYVEGKGHWRPHVKAFTLNVLREGLADRPITRDISWGIPVPVKGFESKRIYVWFEAVIGYLSAAKEWAKIEGRPGDWEKFWKDASCRSYYFLGKDNIVFHTVIWPAMLLGYGGLNLPYDVPANQYMTLEGQKFSKSMGVSIDIPDMLTRFRPDVIRYYLAANMPETKDSEFSWEDFALRVNNELVATYGNFVHRALSFTFKNFGEIPAMGDLDDRDRAAVARIAEAEKEVASALTVCEFRRALKGIMDLAQFGNQYFDAVAPWSLVGADKARCGTVLHVSLLVCKALAVMSFPFLPFSSESVWSQVGMEGTVDEIGWRGIGLPLKTGAKMEKPAPQFAKVEAASAAGGDFQQFSALDLRVGKVLEVGQHPNADKLYLMKVDIGRTITMVSGLKEYYAADELRAKTLVVVTNLEPATIRGVRSEGMLLAAEEGRKLALLTPEKDLPAGTQIASGMEPGKKQVPFKEFQKLDMRAGAIAQLDPPMLDLGNRKVKCVVDAPAPGQKYAAFVLGDRAMVIHGPDKVKIIFDVDIPIGAKIR
ncbi:MAG: methionine--tRNA ligase [Euryarchaeota archaeon RBG_16_62_10]|nr:MAG: methionine--tRNA ligase [Euryarchaeota archaeon RBG_16_62_10]